MSVIYLNITIICNKLFSVYAPLYFLIFNFLIIFFFISVTNGFFRVFINFLFLVNSVLFLSINNVDFFSAFLLAAELPIVLVLLIFYFQKNKLQLDNFYKYTNISFVSKLSYFSFAIFLILLLLLGGNGVLNNFFFYNFIVNDTFSINSRNDFLIIYLIYYKLSGNIVLIFGYLIFFLSLLVIFIFQLNKFYTFKFDTNYKNILVLRRQNVSKQSIFSSKLKFFNKNLM